MGLVWSYDGFLFGIDAPIFMSILLAFLLLSIGDINQTWKARNPVTRANTFAIFSG